MGGWSSFGVSKTSVGDDSGAVNLSVAVHNSNILFFSRYKPPGGQKSKEQKACSCFRRVPPQEA